MLRITLISIRVMLLITSVALVLFGLLARAINDGESYCISQTGLPARMNELTWSAWRHNDGSVYEFPSYPRKPYMGVGEFPEFRRGHVQGWFFGYTFYQGRYDVDGIFHEIPALGPDAGASYRWRWPFLTFALAGCCHLAIRMLARQTSHSRLPSNFHATNVA